MKTAISLSKQLFGAKYERIGKSLLTCGILFCSLYTATIRIAIAPFILYLTATMVSVSMMWQVLHSEKNVDVLMGLLALPFDSRELTCTIALTFSGYTLITRTFPVLAVFYAVQGWSAMQISVSILCACNGCMLAVIYYSFSGTKKRLPAMIWAVSITIAIRIVQNPWIIALIILLSCLLSALHLLHIDAYVFYRFASAAPVRMHSKKDGRVFVYLLRYLKANPNYLLNTLGLCGIACFLPLLLSEFEGLYTFPMGLAILCLNTPLCILLSCDPDLERTLRMLPEQFRLFCTPYCFFIFFFNTLIESIYLLCWHIKNGGIGEIEVLTMLLFAGQGAILSVLLEWRHPIRRWNVEADLWRHPRKYLVPALMMLIAGVIAIWPGGVWIWLCSMILQCLGLLIKGKIL